MNIQPLSYGYTAVGDLITLTLCISNYFFLRSTYASRQKNLYLFVIANSNLIVSCISSILYFSFMVEPDETYYTLICALGIIRRLSLMSIFVIFCQYLCNLIRMKGSVRLIYNLLSYGISSILFILTMVSAITKDTIVYIGLDFAVHNPVMQAYFGLEYLLNALILISILLYYHSRFITKIRHCLCSLTLLSFLLVVGSTMLHSSSYICLSFYFPICGALFLFHHNAFDVSTGCLDRNAFKAYLKDMTTTDYYMLSLTLKELPEEKIERIDEYLFHFNERFFQNTCTFRITETRLLMMLPVKTNPDFQKRFDRMIEEFHLLYKKYLLPYKILYLREDTRLNTANDYFDFLSILEENMEWNTLYHIETSDVDTYIESTVISELLKDIDQKKDLNDKRVMVYCQPVFETSNNVFSTAEALMRIETPETGILYPDVFIPIAERNDYIHTLSLIMLHKCCQQVSLLEEQGYIIERISVNFSALELRSRSFCNDIIQIIQNVGISPSKIAIELTESRNDNDFAIVKSIITQLRSIGIKFYLDDFGTGYSNFERILELPIDIIKFDRSLTNLACSNELSKYMVKNFSKIFIQSNYEILFEGIENASDEELCKEMNAKYLQGYKYSKPIPISRLIYFLEKK